jgi:hypothetical protein
LGTRTLIGTGIVVTAAYWLILIFDIPAFRIVPGYFWHGMVLLDKPLSSFWVFILVVILAVAIIGAVLRCTENIRLNLVLLIVLGWSVQIGFGLSEGNGIDGIRLRMVHAGHAEFARMAAVEVDMLAVATHYEEVLTASAHIRYANTKPPGQLLVYMMTQRISNLVSARPDIHGRFQRLITFSSYVYPLLCYIVLIPLYWFSRQFLSKDDAILVAICYIFVPSTALVTLHLDQVIYPLLFVLCLYLSSRAALRRSLVTALVAGFMTYLSVYVSFSLLPVALLSPLAIIIFSTRWQQERLDFRLNLKLIGAYLAGVAALYLLFKLALSYDPLVRYAKASEHHRIWKEWEPGTANTLLFAALNYIEFLCWVGIPLMVFYLAGLGNSIRNLYRRRIQAVDLFNVSAALMILLMGLLGETKGEVNRLWIFTVPILCVAVGPELKRRFSDKAAWALSALLAAQFATMILIKRYQDFW